MSPTVNLTWVHTLDPSSHGSSSSLQPEPAKLAGTARQLTLQASTGPQSKSAQQAVGSLKLLADTADMQCLLCLSVVVQ